MIENVIFIIGCGHSGTTLLNQIVGNHKNIYNVGYESSLFNLNKHSLLHSWDKERKNKNLKWICEKTPKHVHKINEMYLHVKEPKILVVTRNGFDVIASLKKRYGNLKESVERWLEDNYVWLNHPKKENFHVLKYESFVKNSEEELKKICEFIGEEYDKNMINYEKTPFDLEEHFFDDLICGQKHDLLRKFQINQEIYDGTNRYLTDLSKEDMNTLVKNNSFIEMMKLLDYEIPDSFSVSV